MTQGHNKKAIVIDITNCSISQIVTIRNFPTRHQELYYDTSAGYIPVAYCFEVDAEIEVRNLLKDLYLERMKLAKFEHRMFNDSNKLLQYRVDHIVLRAERKEKA